MTKEYRRDLSGQCAAKPRERDPEDKIISPEDFVPDLRFSGVRPGTIVQPVKSALPPIDSPPSPPPTNDRPK